MVGIYANVLRIFSNLNTHEATYGHEMTGSFFFTVKERFHHGLIIYDILILIGKTKSKNN